MAVRDCYENQEAGFAVEERAMAMHGEDYGSDATMTAYGAAMVRDQPERGRRMMAAVESAGMTDLDQAVAALETLDGQRLSHSGGYPSIITQQIPGYVIWADPGDENGVQLTIYRNAKLVAWYRRARKWLEEEPDEDIVTAMYETRKQAEEL
jgi:hypothetical protein